MQKTEKARFLSLLQVLNDIPTHKKHKPSEKLMSKKYLDQKISGK